MTAKYTVLLSIAALALSLLSYAYQRDSERAGKVIADMSRTIDDQNRKIEDYAKRLRRAEDSSTVWIYCLPDGTPCGAVK